MPTNPILDEFRIMADPEDPWGDVMELWFTVAEGLYATGNKDLIPSEWEFRASPFYDSTDITEDVFMEDHNVFGPVVWSSIENHKISDVLYAGRVITGYAALVKAAGRDY